MPDLPPRIQYEFGDSIREARVVDAVSFGALPNPTELVYKVECGHLVLESDATPI